MNAVDVCMLECQISASYKFVFQIYPSGGITEVKRFKVLGVTLHNLDINIKSSESITLFKCRLSSFIRPVQNSVYNIFDPKGSKFLTRLRLGLSHLNAHTFRHNFQYCLNPSCSCSLVTKDASHYLLQCHHFSNHRALMNSVKSVCDNFESMSHNVKKNYCYMVTLASMKLKTDLSYKQL